MTDINKLRLFRDGIGRLLIGEEIVERSNDNYLVVKNPLLVHMSTDPKSGQLAINFFPETFPEFLADKEAGTIWSYPKTIVSICDKSLLDIKLQSHYMNTFNPQQRPPISTPTTPSTGSVNNQATKLIKLFDD